MLEADLPGSRGLVSHRRFPTLDGYRAIAAFMVVTTHVAFASGLVAELPWGAVPARFDIGVTIFFLLSGFLLYRPWALAAMTARPGPRVGPFYWRRGVRIFPAYWVMLAFTLLVLPTIQPVAASTWAAHIPLLQIYLMPGVGGLSQIWSLATEVAFYAVLPVVAGRRPPGRGRRPHALARFSAWLMAAAGWASSPPARRAPGLTSFNASFWLPGCRLVRARHGLRGDQRRLARRSTRLDGQDRTARERRPDA
jgi:peptidoglycan/LPS O-acetylase OafA/YrhL